LNHQNNYVDRLNVDHKDMKGFILMVQNYF